MKTIPLTQGKFALVDDEDFDRINAFKWYARKAWSGDCWYATRMQTIGKKQSPVQMHREILGLSKSDPKVDHRDRDGLNNQRDNIRPASNAQNMMNKIGSSRHGYKGIGKMPGNPPHPWQAHIGVNGVLLHLGSFATALEAAQAYNAKALEVFGEFARLNPV